MKTFILILFLCIACQKEKIPSYEWDLEFINKSKFTLTIHLYSGTAFDLAIADTYIYGNNGLLPNIWQTNYFCYKKNTDTIYYTGIVKGRNEIW